MVHQRQSPWLNNSSQSAVVGTRIIHPTQIGRMMIHFEFSLWSLRLNPGRGHISSDSKRLAPRMPFVILRRGTSIAHTGRFTYCYSTMTFSSFRPLSRLCGLRPSPVICAWQYHLGAGTLHSRFGSFRGSKTVNG